MDTNKTKASKITSKKDVETDNKKKGAEEKENKSDKKSGVSRHPTKEPNEEG